MPSKNDWCDVDALGDWLRVSRRGTTVCYNLAHYPRLQLTEGRLVLRQAMPKVDTGALAPIVIPFNPDLQEGVIDTLEKCLRTPATQTMIEVETADE